MNPRRSYSPILALSLLVVAGFAGPARSADRKQLLIVGQSKGYQHDAVSAAMVTLYQLGKETGEWDAHFRTDCGNITKKPLKWEAKNLDRFDAVVFFTDGDLDMDESQKADLLSFIRDDGKGFLGIHSASITFTGWPEYGRMLGGSFDGHPWGQFEAPLVVEAPDFPGMTGLPARFTLKDEIYQIKGFSRDKVRVLLSVDPDKVDLARPGVSRAGREFPVAWARDYGKGRVAYNGLGHRLEAWERPEMRAMWRDTTRWVLGFTPGDASPRPAVSAR